MSDLRSSWGKVVMVRAIALRTSPERAVELRLSKIRGRLAQNLVGLPQFAHLALQRLHLVGDLGRTPARLPLFSSAFFTQVYGFAMSFSGAICRAGWSTRWSTAP